MQPLKGSRLLNDAELQQLGILFKRSADEASRVLSQWLGRPAHLAFGTIEQISVSEAAPLLGFSDEPIVMCVMSVEGRFKGQLILAFSDQSGFSLAELLVPKQCAELKEWTDLARSAALETANIVGCAYLGTLSQYLPDQHGDQALLPSPPQFLRNYGASLMQGLVMGQAMVSDTLIFTHTQFRIDGAPVIWKLLLVPELECFASLQEALR